MYPSGIDKIAISSLTDVTFCQEGVRVQHVETTSSFMT